MTDSINDKDPRLGFIILLCFTNRKLEHPNSLKKTIGMEGLQIAYI